MITFTEAQIVAWLSPIIWPFLRVLAVFSSAPVFSSKSFPLRARIALAFFIAFAAQPSLQGQAMVSITSADAFGTVAQQVGIGLAIGFTVRLVLAAVQMAGEVIGFQMGLGFASFFDPTLSSQSSGQVLWSNGHLFIHRYEWPPDTDHGRGQEL